MPDQDLETKNGSEASTEQPNTPLAEPKVEGAEVATAKESLEDVLKTQFEKSTSQLDEANSANGDVLKKNTTNEEKTAEKVEEKKEEPSTEEKKEPAQEEKGPVPLERFQEVNEKAKKFELELADEKPWADAQRTLAKNLQEANVSEEQFFYWVEVAKLASTNPAKALERLKPTLDYLQRTSGDSLPEDLAKAVADGELTKEMAQRIAKAEAQQKWGQQSQEKTAQELRQQRLTEETTRFVSDMKSALDGWVSSKKTDVDFVPKKNEKEPNGKFEFVMNEIRLSALDAQQKGTLKTPKDLVDMANAAYVSVGASFGKLAPRQKVNGSHVSSTKSSGTVSQEPKSLDEALSNRLKQKHGIDWSPAVRK